MFWRNPIVIYATKPYITQDTSDELYIVYIIHSEYTDIYDALYYVDALNTEAQEQGLPYVWKLRLKRALEKDMRTKRWVSPDDLN